MRTSVKYEKSIDLLSKNQKYLASWEEDGALIVLGIVENSNTLIVNKFIGNSDHSVQVFDFGNVVNDRLLSISSLYDLFDDREGKIQKIDASIPVGLGIASAKNKAYLITDFHDYN